MLTTLGLKTKSGAQVQPTADWLNPGIITTNYCIMGKGLYTLSTFLDITKAQDVPSTWFVFPMNAKSFGQIKALEKSLITKVSRNDPFGNMNVFA